ncbi:ATPase involved in DNA repair (plasmid) [Nostoc flagelliforme CCNUN1]|uniref:ATPase involved in DNA repair n=2 Tax=Nostoc flagelliforme TaxID=1306274 RepID=A0A2K8TA85_9NOSO|nr:ATPase involved in DNA repair [Nostoc flagelliforme CCNUN1]
MLTLDRETKPALHYDDLNSSIKDTFAAIDRFELQAVEQIRLMHDERMYRIAGYKNFSQYCQGELHVYGGYRRINQLLGASKVIVAAGELGPQIKNERQARPLLRLVKEPEKLIAAIALALSSNPEPSESDFAAAANIVAPMPRVRKPFHQEPLVPKNQEPLVPKNQEPLVPKNMKVTISSPSHPRYGESGVIEAEAPNNSQQIVTFADGERLLVNNTDLDAAIVSDSTERTYPKEYSEAIAELKEQHKLELERLEQELRIGLQAEVSARAEAQVSEQIQSMHFLYKEQKEQNIQLQQRLDEMEGLRNLKIENQQLHQRIGELEHALLERPQQQWGNTMTQQATKVLNKQVKQALEKTIDLRSLALEPPKENATECLRLMGMALKNLASAMNNTQALEAAALILGTSPTRSAIAIRTEQLQLLPQAIREIRQVLAKPGCSWQDFCTVAQHYEVIKADYWAELTTSEKELISALNPKANVAMPIQVGSIVCHADPYHTLYIARGKVIQDLGEQVVVAWDNSQDEPKNTSIYLKNELRFPGSN